MPGNRPRNWLPHQERKGRKNNSSPAEIGDKARNQVTTQFMKMGYNVEFWSQNLRTWRYFEFTGMSLIFVPCSLEARRGHQVGETTSRTQEKRIGHKC